MSEYVKYQGKYWKLGNTIFAKIFSVKMKTVRRSQNRNNFYNV